MKNRPSVPVDSDLIDLTALAAEVGAPLCMGDGVVVAAEGATVTQAQLAAAVKAHKPSKAVAEPPLSTAELGAVRALLTSTR